MFIGLKRVTTWMQIILFRIISIICVRYRKLRRARKFDDYEADEHFTLEWVEPDKAIVVNRTVDHGPKEQNMLNERQGC